MIQTKSFQKNLLASVGGIFILFVISFSLYQYQREKEYKIDILQSRLQMYNYEMMQTLGRDSLLNNHTFLQYVRRHNVEGLRVSVIRKDGQVFLDSYDVNVQRMGNHLQRKEIQEALKEGNGYDIKRTSQSTHETYFYSATRFGDLILRAAVPYSAALTRSLQADNTYLYFTLAMILLLGIVLYVSTRRISRHISYLREFALKTERGEPLDHELERKLPDDELGEISHTIIQLYWKERHSEEDKQRIKRQLTQNAAHELKTPAASIHGYLESILDHPDLDPEKRQHFLERCYAQSERMNKLLLDMAQLTKLDEWQNPLRQKGEDSTYTVLDVVPVIHNVLDDTALQLESKGLAVQLQLPERILIHGEQSFLYSIFRNLVDNALSYAIGATKLELTATEGTKDGQPCYQFRFSDNGPGVEPQHLLHLFERFYRVDKGRSRKLGGTGLGLAIVKNAVAAHGGTTTASCTPGGGLTISFTLMR